MTSFLKIFPRSKSKEHGKELKGPYTPLDTLNLEHSISAVPSNLSLYCKSCKTLQSSTSQSSSREEGKTSDYPHRFAGLVGIISKGIFMIYQVDLNESDQIFCKLLENVEICRANNPLVKPTFIFGKWIRLKKQKHEMTVLVLVSTIGVDIYPEDGSTAPLCTYNYAQGSVPELMCRNVAATGSQILTGNGRGEVHVFEFCDGKVNFRGTNKVQDEPITQLICCRRSILATGSPSGTIRVWKIWERKAIKMCCFKTQHEECVTGMGVWDGCIVATYGSGLFRIFHLQSRKLLARVAAHSRWIGNMDLLAHRGEGLLLTVSEDDVVLIWKLTMNLQNLKSFGSITNIKNKIKSIQRNKRFKRKQSKICVSLESNIPVDNMLLVGGKFVNCTGNVVALANYGAKEVYFYSSRIMGPTDQN